MSGLPLKAVFAIPGDLDTPTGGYAYARRLIEAAPSAGLAVQPLMLPGDFPAPSAASLRLTAESLGAIGPDTPLLVDGLAFGALPPALLASVKAPMAVLLHHPLGLEGNLPRETAQALLDSERDALVHARAIIVPSATTRDDAVASLGADPALIAVAPPGLDPVKPSPTPDNPPLILSVGSLIPRKGHDVLVAALATLKDLAWTATIAGAASHDPRCAEALRGQIVAAGLADRITLPGVLRRADLDALYDRASLFCLPSRHEGYGMVFAEAMAHGLPVIAGDIDAAREVVPVEAGLHLPIDRADAFAKALALLLRDPARRAAMGKAGRVHAATLPDWPQTAAKIANVLQGIAR